MSSPPTPKANRTTIESAQATLYEEGTKLRQEVLGADHIAASKALPEFLQPVQTMAVVAGWSLCWTRPGLERKTRSLLCLVMLAVLGRDNELAGHVRGAVANGCSELEIREALLQASVYAGVPCSLNATRVAWKVLEELKEEGKLE
ncbi:CMD-domain-containing protein [Aspergillus pseudoustus]|uniref:CMD-domain-containing protein n=1 Tax=Aspergillus pseudoustus TaxID=1810923 RepID=A0ABR4IHL8_9EURO